MIETFVEFSRYFVALLFGVAVAVNFAGMARIWKNYLVVACFTVILFVWQVICLMIWGMSITIKIYPLLSHLPVAVLIVVFLKRTWLISLTSMFVSFLCCQPPRWIGAVTGEIFDSAAMDHIGYIATAFLMFFLLQKYVFDSARHLMERSVKSCLLFGVIPAFYYLFDYISVYTNYIYSGTRTALQFIPFVTATFYFIFVLIYYVETQKQSNLQRERDMLDIQFRQAQIEFASLRQIQQNAMAYRHDMRHHFSLLQSLASEERIEDIREYLQTAQSDIDAITPVRFCKNETVNLILSAFVKKARQAEIQLNIEARLPAVLSFSDTEICSLLSNALENSIHASKDIPDKNKRIIQLRIYSKNNKLCIDIRNRYQIEPLFINGFPVTKEQGHGFGTKNMAHITEKHGGVYNFFVKDGWFIFQAAA